MASPFSLFRKYRRTLLAVFGVLLMIAFTFGSGAFLQDSRSRGQDNPVVVSSKYGSLRESDIDRLRQQKNLVFNFLSLSLNLPPQMAPFFRQQFSQIIGSLNEEELVEDWFMLREAQARGVFVPDEAVTQFINQMTSMGGRPVASSVFEKAQRELQDKSPLRPTWPVIYDAVRSVLTTRQMRSMAEGLLQPTPAERFEAYQRLRRRAAVELVPVSVDEFTAKVPTPADSELRALYEKHKKQEPVPGSPEPGFKIPAKTQFLYVKADYEKFVKPDDITPQEIQEHYDKFKDQQYLFSGLGPNPEPPPPAKPETKPVETKPEAKKPDETKPDAKPPADKPTETKPAETKPATPPKTESKTPEPPTKEPAKQEPEKKEPEKKEPPKSEPEKKSEPDKKDQSQDWPMRNDRNRRGLDGTADEQRLALAEDAQKEAAKQTGEAPKSDAVPALTPPKTEPPKTEPPKADEPATKSPPAAAPATPPTLPADVKKPEPPPLLTEKYKLPDNVQQGPSPKHDPLWKVEGEIRNTLARQKANARIDKLFNEIDNTLRPYSQGLLSWELSQRTARDAKKPESAPPAAPDLVAKAKQVSDADGLPDALTAHDTGLISIYQAAKIPGLGESSLSDGRSFVGYACRSSMRLYSLGSTVDLAGNRYRFIKVASKEGYVPSFEEAKSDVLAAYKKIEARKLAQKHADALAAEARKQPKPLKELFAADKSLTFLEPPAFSWLTRGSAGATDSRSEPRLSEVEGVNDAGDDFMRGIFSLEDDGSVGVTWNQPQDIAYVVRVKSFSPSPHVLRTTFLIDSPFESAAAGFNDQRRTYRAWLDGRKQLAQFEWKRDPRQEEE